jgi:hypothetical protein
MPREVIIPISPMRYVIVHYHIFKNAGTTIESILDREFGPGFATLHGPSTDSTLTGSELERFLVANPQVEAVSSHHLRYPKPVIPGVVLFDCCFLRHPLVRLHSYYTYLNRTGAIDSHSPRARGENVREFLEHLLDAAPHLVSNVQVNLLANAGAFTRLVGERDLRRATGVLREMAIPGLLGMFDESLTAAEYFLRPAFPTIRLEYVAKNVTGSVPIRLDERREDLVELWGQGLYEQLDRLNQMDLELFRRAREEVTRRMNMVPRAAERLADFRSRCAELEGLREYAVSPA